MARVTSKLQVTVPKTVAERLSIRPGDDIEWRVEGEAARVTRRRTEPRALADRLAIFDSSTRRQEVRNRAWAVRKRRPAANGRGWTREELYPRGRGR